jgi:hypothetical protein
MAELVVRFLRPGYPPDVLTTAYTTAYRESQLLQRTLGPIASHPRTVTLNASELCTNKGDDMGALTSYNLRLYFRLLSRLDRLRMSNAARVRLHVRFCEHSERVVQLKRMFRGRWRLYEATVRQEHDVTSDFGRGLVRDVLKQRKRQDAQEYQQLVQAVKDDYVEVYEPLWSYITEQEEELARTLTGVGEVEEEEELVVMDSRLWMHLLIVSRVLESMSAADAILRFIAADLGAFEAMEEWASPFLGPELLQEAASIAAGQDVLGTLDVLGSPLFQGTTPFTPRPPPPQAAPPSPLPAQPNFTSPAQPTFTSPRPTFTSPKPNFTSPKPTFTSPKQANFTSSGIHDEDQFPERFRQQSSKMTLELLQSASIRVASIARSCSLAQQRERDANTVPRGTTPRGAPSPSPMLTLGNGEVITVCVCVCVCANVFVCVRVRACVRCSVSISPVLIMNMYIGAHEE